MGRQQVGGHVNLNKISKTLGFEPEVGETIVAGELTLRVLSRTIGLEFDAEGTEQWYDRLFIVTSEAVDDIEAVGHVMRDMFGESEYDENGDSKMIAAQSDDDDARAVSDLAGGDGFDAGVLRDLEDLLGDL